MTFQSPTGRRRPCDLRYQCSDYVLHTSFNPQRDAAALATCETYTVRLASTYVSIPNGTPPPLRRTLLTHNILVAYSFNPQRDAAALAT